MIEKKKREKKEKRNKTSDSILMFSVIASLMIVVTHIIISAVYLNDFTWIFAMVFVFSISVALFTE